ncbi:MAG: NAD(P)/FAD-dependent oxidoreductase [Actinobacteria bacterium]|nr:NAD(P)/FAD-dependent oxidoreductase [Actinomycetota bacterium]
MSDRFDLTVIGAGMAGIAAANKAAAAGWRTAIIDELPYGGTCALRGCDPKKILRRTAEIVDAARLMAGKGIDPNGLAVNWRDLMAHKRGFTAPVPPRMEDQLSTNGAHTLHGTATFLSPATLAVNGEAFESRRFLVATGARPRPLDFAGAEHVIDSTAFLELDDLPDRIVFIGGGFVSFEFAHIAARAGATVTILDRGSRPLKAFDPDLVELLVARGAAIGIKLHRNTSVDRVSAGPSGWRLDIVSDGQADTVAADLVVHGAGRRPDLDSLDLDAANVAYSERGVTVSPHLQSTSNDAVFAAGDAADSPGMPLTPVAMFEAKVATSNLLNDTTRVPDYRGVPTAVFTVPELARVGQLEEEARASGVDLDVRHTDTSGWYSNYRIGEPTAAVKILIDRATDTIVGAHMFGPEYGELINIVGLAIKLGLTTRQLKSMTAAYPTTGSDLGSML